MKKNYFSVLILLILINIIIFTSCEVKEYNNKENSNKNTGENLSTGINKETNVQIPSTNKKRDNLSQLKEFKSIKDQSFWVDLKNWGKVHFVSGLVHNEFEIRKVAFYIVDKQDNIIIKLPEFYGNTWVFDSIYDIAFRDVNNDGLKDVIVVAMYIKGHGNNAATVFPVGGIYYRKDNKFINIPELDKKINDKKQNNNIDMILKFVEENNIKFNELNEFQGDTLQTRGRQTVWESA